jgi:hypothetical protein
MKESPANENYIWITAKPADVNAAARVGRSVSSLGSQSRVASDRVPGLHSIGEGLLHPSAHGGAIRNDGPYGGCVGDSAASWSRESRVGESRVVAPTVRPSFRIAWAMRNGMKESPANENRFGITAKPADVNGAARVGSSFSRLELVSLESSPPP